MKSFLSSMVMLSVLTVGFSAQADDYILFNCTVNKLVDSSVFEESLSEVEYPDVTLTESEEILELILGANYYNESDGDKFIKLSTLGQDITYKILPESGAEPILVKVKKNKVNPKAKTSTAKKIKKSGWVYVIKLDENGKDQNVLIAKLICE